MTDKKIFYLKLVIFILLLAWFGFLMAEKIDLTTADLGRHLKNGEIILSQGLKMGEANTVLDSNFYSYTNQDYPFVNHHWASGVVFFLIYELAGFSGLSISYIFLSVLIFSIAFYIACRESNFTVAAILSILLIPLMAERREIRPEIFSYFFAVVFFLLLWLWSRKKISVRWLFLLPILMIFWVNFHIYFFLGLFIIGVFLVSEIGGTIFSRLTDDAFEEKIQKIKRLFALFFLSFAATFLNPSGLAGAIHPFNVYKNYGYTVAEEKSVWFVENYGIVNSNYLLIKAVLILIILSFILLFVLNRKKIFAPYLMLAVFFGAIGLAQIRNFTLFGFFVLPILASNFENIFTPSRKDNLPAKENGLALMYIAVFLVAIYANFQFVSLHRGNRGVGLLPGNESAADFLRNEKIAGPIFNNYDIGGYLIWNLPENEKVFVDNRPEAYPDSFFSGVYKPMQENPDIFKKIDQQYNFNTVVFSRNDITPWGMNFLKMIKEDQGWAPVFEDTYAVIYLKKNEISQPIIEKYAGTAGSSNNYRWLEQKNKRRHSRRFLE